MLFRMVLSATPYDLLFPRLGASRGHLHDSTAFLFYMYGHDPSLPGIESHVTGQDQGYRRAACRGQRQRWSPLRVGVVTRSV